MSGADNPSAFPIEAPFAVDRGMTLRDWFAGQAFVSIVDRPLSHGMSQIQPNSPMHPDKAASVAYRYADAMLAERSKGGAA